MVKNFMIVEGAAAHWPVDSSHSSWKKKISWENFFSLQIERISNLIQLKFTKNVNNSINICTNVEVFETWRVTK